MRNPVIVFIAALALTIAIFPQTATAETAQRGGAGRGNAPPPGPQHDPRDLSGIWLQRGGGPSSNPVSEWTKEQLPFTPKGKAEFEARKPGKGPRAGLPAAGNDPLSEANVPGLLRTLVYARPFQFIHTPDKVVQLFEWFRIWREIWTDGRKMPEDPGPRFYGYSISRWEGDAFVVETAGLDPRLWGDEWGMPFSEDMRVLERWRRLDRDNMELTITFTDPVMYTKPWTTDTKRFRLQPKGSPNGEMLEVIFAPIDEQDFNAKIRNPSNGVPR
ncbi:MAG: hypothetical protein DMG15_00050 [Acidobacteria bacterium]|nr:MAG: hypothetical protein DMG15_00050 [Acidobacteriota bacterium]